MTISILEAREKGFTTYTNGRKCKYDHARERYVTNNGCVECNKANSRRQVNSGYSSHIKAIDREVSGNLGKLTSSKESSLAIYKRTLKKAFKNRDRWSIDDDVSLRMLFYIGLKGFSVAMLLGRTSNAITARKKYLNVS